MSQSVEQRIRDLEALQNPTSLYPTFGRNTLQEHNGSTTTAVDNGRHHQNVETVDDIDDSRSKAQHAAAQIRPTSRPSQIDRTQAFAYNGGSDHRETYNEEELDSLWEYDSEATSQPSATATVAREFASKACSATTSLSADSKDDAASSIHSHNNIIHRWEQRRREQDQRMSENKLPGTIRASESHSTTAVQTDADESEIRSPNMALSMQSSWVSEFDQSSVDTQRTFQKLRIFRKKYFDEAVSRLQCSRQLEEISEHCELKHATEIAGFGSVSEDPITLISGSDSAFDIFDAELFHNPFRETVTSSLPRSTIRRSLSNESTSPKRHPDQKRRRSKSVPKRPTRSEMERNQQFTSRIAQYLHDVARVQVNGSFDNTSTISSDATSRRPSLGPIIQESGGRRSTTILRYVQDFAHVPHSGSFDSSSVIQSESHLFVKTTKSIDQGEDSSVETPKQSNRHRDTNPLAAWSSRKLSLSSPSRSGHEIGLFFTGDTFEDGEDPHKNPFLERRYETSPHRCLDSMVAPVHQRHSDAILNYLRDFSGIEGSGSFDTGSLVSFASTVFSSSVVSAALLSTPRTEKNPSGLLTEQEISAVKSTLLLHRQHGDASKRHSRRRRRSRLSIGRPLPNDKRVGSSAILDYLKTFSDVHGSGSFDNRSYSTMNTEIGTAITKQDAVDDHGSVESIGSLRRGIQCAESSGAIVDYLRVLNELDASGSFDTTRTSSLGESSHRHSISNLESTLHSRDVSDRSSSSSAAASEINESVLNPAQSKNPVRHSSAIFDYLRGFPRAGLNASFDSSSQLTELISLASIETDSVSHALGLERLPNICETSDTFEETTDSESNPFRPVEDGETALLCAQQGSNKCLQRSAISLPRDDSSTVLNYLRGLSKVPHSVGSFDSASQTSSLPYVTPCSDNYRQGRGQKDQPSPIESFDSASQANVMPRAIPSYGDQKHGEENYHAMMSRNDVSGRQEVAMKRETCDFSCCDSKREEVSSTAGESLCPDQRNGAGSAANSHQLCRRSQEHIPQEKQVPYGGSFDDASVRSIGSIKFQSIQDTFTPQRHRRRSSTGSLQSSTGRSANQSTVFQYLNGLSTLTGGGSFDDDSGSYSSMQLDLRIGGDGQSWSKLLSLSVYPNGPGYKLNTCKPNLNPDPQIRLNNHDKECGEDGNSCPTKKYGGSIEEDSLRGIHCVLDRQPGFDRSRATWKKPSSINRDTSRKESNFGKESIVQNSGVFNTPGNNHNNEDNAHPEREATDPKFSLKESSEHDGSIDKAILRQTSWLPDRLSDLDRTTEKTTLTWAEPSGINQDTKKVSKVDKSSLVQKSGILNSSVGKPSNKNIAQTESAVTNPMFWLGESSEHGGSSHGKSLRQDHCLSDCEIDLDRMTEKRMATLTPPSGTRGGSNVDQPSIVQNASILHSFASDHNSETIVPSESEVTDPTFLLGESDDGNESNFSDLACFPSSSTVEANCPEEVSCITVTEHNGDYGTEVPRGLSMVSSHSGQSQSNREEDCDAQVNQVIDSEFADADLVHKEDREESRAVTGRGNSDTGPTDFEDSKRSKSIGSVKQYGLEEEQEARVSYLRREKRRVEASVRRLSMSKERESSAASTFTDNQHHPCPQKKSLFSRSPEKKALIDRHLSELEEVFRKVQRKGSALEGKDRPDKTKQISQASPEPSRTLSFVKDSPTENEPLCDGDCDRFQLRECAREITQPKRGEAKERLAPSLPPLGYGDSTQVAVSTEPQAKVCLFTVESPQSLNSHEEHKNRSSSPFFDDSSSLDESAFGKAMEYYSPSEHPKVPIQVAWDLSVPFLRPVSPKLLGSPRSEETGQSLSAQEIPFIQEMMNRLGATEDDKNSPPADTESLHEIEPFGTKRLTILSRFTYIEGTTSNSPIFMVKSTKGRESPSVCMSDESYNPYKGFAKLGEPDRSISITATSSEHDSGSAPIEHAFVSSSASTDLSSSPTVPQPAAQDDVSQSDQQIQTEESQDPFVSVHTLKSLWEQQPGSTARGFEKKSLHIGQSQSESAPTIPFKPRHNQKRKEYNLNTGEQDSEELSVGNGVRTMELSMRNWSTREESSEELTHHAVPGLVNSNNRSGVETAAEQKVPPFSVVSPVSKGVTESNATDCVPKSQETELRSISDSETNTSLSRTVINTKDQGRHRAVRIPPGGELRSVDVPAPSTRRLNGVSKLEHAELWRAASLPSPVSNKRNPSGEDISSVYASLYCEAGEFVGADDFAIYQTEHDAVARESGKASIDTTIASPSETFDLSRNTIPPKLPVLQRGVHKRPSPSNLSGARVIESNSIDVHSADNTTLEKPQIVNKKQLYRREFKSEISLPLFQCDERSGDDPSLGEPQTRLESKEGQPEDESAVGMSRQRSKPRIHHYHTHQGKNEEVVQSEMDSKNTAQDCTESTPQSKDSLPLFQSDLVEQIAARERNADSTAIDKREEGCPIDGGFTHQASQATAFVRSSCTRPDNQIESAIETSSQEKRYRAELNVNGWESSDPVSDPMLVHFRTSQSMVQAPTDKQHQASHIFQHGREQVEYPALAVKASVRAARADNKAVHYPQNLGAARESPIPDPDSAHTSKLDRVGKKFSRTSVRKRTDPLPEAVEPKRLRNGGLRFGSHQTISRLDNLLTKAPTTMDTKYLLNSIASAKPSGDQSDSGRSPLTSMKTNPRCDAEQTHPECDFDSGNSINKNCSCHVDNRIIIAAEKQDSAWLSSVGVCNSTDGGRSVDPEDSVSETSSRGVAQAPTTSAFIRGYQQVARRLGNHIGKPSESTSNWKNFEKSPCENFEGSSVSREPLSSKPTDCSGSPIQVSSTNRESPSNYLQASPLSTRDPPETTVDIALGKNPIPPDKLCFDDLAQGPNTSFLASSTKQTVGHGERPAGFSLEHTESKESTLAGRANATSEGCTTQPPHQRLRARAIMREQSISSTEKRTGHALLTTHAGPQAPGTVPPNLSSQDVAHDHTLYQSATGMNRCKTSVHAGKVRGSKHPQNTNSCRENNMVASSPCQTGLKNPSLPLNTSPQISGLPRRPACILGDNLVRKDDDKDDIGEFSTPAPSVDLVSKRPISCREETEEPYCHGATDGDGIRSLVDIDQLDYSQQLYDKGQTEAGPETIKPDKKQSLDTRGIRIGRAREQTNETPPSLSLAEPTDGHDTVETFANHVGEQANPFSIARERLRVARAGAAWSQPKKVTLCTPVTSEVYVRSKTESSFAPSFGLSFLSREQIEHPTSKAEAEATTEPTTQAQNARGANSVVFDDVNCLVTKDRAIRSCDHISSLVGETNAFNTKTASNDGELDPLPTLEASSHPTFPKSDRELNLSTSRFSLDSICSAMCDRENVTFGTDHVILNSANRADWPKVAIPNSPLTGTSPGKSSCFEHFDHNNCFRRLSTVARKSEENAEPSLSSQEKTHGKRESTSELEETIMIVPEATSGPDTPSELHNFFGEQKPVIDRVIDQPISSIRHSPDAQLSVPSVSEEASSLPRSQSFDIDLPPVESSFSVNDSLSVEGKKRAQWAKVVEEFREKIAGGWSPNNKREVEDHTEVTVVTVQLSRDEKAFPHPVNPSRNNEDAESGNESSLFSDFESVSSDIAICPHASPRETVGNGILLPRFQRSNTLENADDLLSFNGLDKHGKQSLQSLASSPSDRTILALQQDQISYSNEERDEGQDDDKRLSTDTRRPLSPIYYSSEEDTTSCGVSSSSASSSSSSSYVLSSSGSESSARTEDYEAHCRDPPSMRSSQSTESEHSQAGDPEDYETQFRDPPSMKRSQSTESGHSQTDAPPSALPILPPLPARSTRNPNESYPMIRRGSFDEVVVLPEIGSSSGQDPPVYSPPGYSRQLPTPFHDTLLESMSPLLSADSNDDEHLQFVEEKPEEQQPGCAQAFCGGIDFLQDKLCGMCNF